VERLQALPGVEAVSLTRGVPLRLSHSTTEVRVPGQEPPPGTEGFVVDLAVVGRGYFQTLRLPIVAGRDFDDRDARGTVPVAIVSQAMAERFWPGQDAVGRRFAAGEGDADSLVIVGVARNAAHRRLGETPRALVYLPFAQSYSSTMTLLVRTVGAPNAVAPALRREVSALEPDLPISSLMPLREFIGIALLPQRMAAAVAGSLGAIGLLLALVGVFSVVSHAVGQRTREIGIRVALGARPHEVLSLVIRQGMTLTLVGVGAGLAIALATTRFLSSFLLGVSPADLPTFAGIPALLAGAALLASYIPARRASRIDPLEALREA
jgi:predicted permease